MNSPRLGTKIILTYVAFVVPVLAVSGFFYYDSARRKLDAELGERLVAVAQAAATRFNPLILSYIEPGDEQGRTYQSYRSSLAEIRDRTGLERIFVFGLDMRSILDTEDSIPVGTPYARLRFQRSEIESTLEGEPAASVLFRGDDGRWYKTGFAVIAGSDGEPVALAAADASAAYLSHIAGLRRSVIFFVLIGAAVTVLLGFLLARSASRPLGRLVSQADRIGSGRMDRPVDPGKAGAREIESLALALERMRQRLAQREENQRLMIAGVAHEIRNPLGGIELFASLARKELEQGTDAARYMQRVIDESGSLKNIIHHFLEFARPAPPEIETLEVEKVVETAAGFAGPRLQRNGIELETEIGSGAGSVRADREQLSRALLNLLVNAAEAVGAGEGRITVSSHRDGPGLVRLEVSDNGRGMDRETLGRIFNPFFTTRDDGMGLGLPIVKKTIEENGGWIEVESEPGRGTTFRLFLPAP